MKPLLYVAVTVLTSHTLYVNTDIINLCIYMLNEHPVAACRLAF